MRPTRLTVLAFRLCLQLALLACIALSLAAFAQDPATPAPVATGVNLDAVLLVVIKVVGLVLTGFVLVKLHAFLDAHASDKNASAASREMWDLLDKVEHFVEVGVAGAMPTVQSDLGANKPLGDVAKDAATTAKTYLGSAGLGALGDVLGLGADAVTKYLQDLAAKKVAAAQAAGASAALKVQTGPDAAAAMNKVG